MNAYQNINPRRYSTKSKTSSCTINTPCTPNCTILTGKLKPIPTEVLNILNSDQAQDYINNELKVGELPKLKSVFRKFWIHENPAKRRGRHPQQQDVPWYYLHKIAKEDAVLESYVRPPLHVIASHNALARSNGWELKPANYRPYHQIELKRSKKKKEQAKVKDNFSLLALGHFGLNLHATLRQKLDFTSVIERVKINTPSGLMILSTARYQMSCVIPLRVELKNLNLKHQPFQANDFTERNQVQTIEKFVKTCVQRNVYTETSPVYQGIVMVTITLETIENTIKLVPTKRHAYQSYPKPRICLCSDNLKRYKSWKRRFKCRATVVFSNQSSKRMVIDLFAESR